MSKNTPEKQPKIHVTSRGGWYVEADELLASDKVREKIEKMAKIPVDRKPSDTSSGK